MRLGRLGMMISCWNQEKKFVSATLCSQAWTSLRTARADNTPFTQVSHW